MMVRSSPGSHVPRDQLEKEGARDRDHAQSEDPQQAEPGGPATGPRAREVPSAKPNPSRALSPTNHRTRPAARAAPARATSWTVTVRSCDAEIAAIRSATASLSLPSARALTSTTSCVLRRSTSTAATTVPSRTSERAWSSTSVHVASNGVPDIASASWESDIAATAGAAISSGTRCRLHGRHRAG